MIWVQLPISENLFKTTIQHLQKLLLKLSYKNNTNKKILIKYSFFSWLFLKKLQKEGFIRFCVIKQTSLNFAHQNSKLFIEVRVSKPLNSLKLLSSTKSKTSIKSYNSFAYQNLGLMIKSNSKTYSSFLKDFGEVFLILK